MKNVFILLLFLLAVGESFGQAENNKWYFGIKAAINFGSPVPTTLNDNPNQPTNSNGAGTVSDKVTGDLLFYTNGQTIWNKNHTIMPNGNDLNGGFCGVFGYGQSGLICPSISNRNQYYVFSTSTTANTQCNLAVGLFYSIVDMSLGINNSGDVVAGEKNVELLDENHQPFSIPTPAINMAVNNLGNAYWILFPYGNRLYAYRLDSTGIITTPVVSLFSTVPATPGNTFLKVNSNNNIIGTSGGGFYNFNNATGQITSPYAFQPSSTNYTNLEFSANGNLAFLNGTNYVQPSDAVVTVFNLTNGLSRQINTPLNDSFLLPFQRAINNEIYFGSYPSSGGSPNQHLSKITNPANFNTTITYNNISFSGDQYPAINLPQLIPQLTCALYEELIGNNITANYSYQVSDHITTSGDYAVNLNQNINLYSNNYVEMKANTHLKSGATVLAKIQACPVPANRISNAATEETSIKSDSETKLIVYPNPTSDWVTITVGKSKIHSISIIAITDGKTIYNKENVSDTAYKIDCSNFAKGIYIVEVKTIEGNTYKEKIIKN